MSFIIRYLLVIFANASVLNFFGRFGTVVLFPDLMASSFEDTALRVFLLGAFTGTICMVLTNLLFNYKSK